MRLVSLSLLAGLFAASTAFAGPEQAPAAPGELTSLAQLPAQLREAIGQNVSDRGGPFAAGCVSAKGEPHSRFSSARIDAGKAVVTIERGGIAHFYDKLEFTQVDGRWVASAPSAPRR